MQCRLCENIRKYIEMYAGSVLCAMRNADSDEECILISHAIQYPPTTQYTLELSILHLIDIAESCRADIVR